MSALLSITAAGLLAAAPSLQDYRWFERGWYVGGAVGTARADVSESQLDGELAAQGFMTTSQIDDEDTAWKAWGGYRFEGPLALEASYVSLGRLRSEVDTTVVDLDTFLDALADTQPFLGEGVGLAGVLYPLDVDRFALGLRAGAWYWQADVEARASTGERSSVDKDGVDPFFGLHGLFDLTETVQLRAEVERYFVDGEGVDLLSFGIQFRIP